MKIWAKILTYRKPKLHLVPKFCQLLQRIFCCQNSEYIWNIKGMERYRNLVSSITTMTPLHTVAIWIFTFHKKSGFVRVILKANQPTSRIHHFFGLEIQIYYTHFSSIFCRICQIQCFFTRSCCYSKEFTCLYWELMQKSQFKHINSLE